MAELGLENDALSYNDASGMIYSLHQLVARVPSMRLSNVTSVETTYFDKEGIQCTTMGRVEDFFSTNEMKVEDHNLYHVTSYENAQGKSMPDPNYENFFDYQCMVDRPPTKDLNGINEDGFIHPVKVKGKGMHNVWLVPAGSVGWAIVHHIQSQTMPRSCKFTL